MQVKTYGNGEECIHGKGCAISQRLRRSLRKISRQTREEVKAIIARTCSDLGIRSAARIKCALLGSKH